MTADARPTGGHTMRVTLEYKRLALIPVCHEPGGASCRVTCAADSPCETYSYPEHECGLKPLDFCNAVEWLTNGDDFVEEFCGENTAFPMFDGMPITVEWEGGGYSWSPVNTLVAVTT